MVSQSVSQSVIHAEVTPSKNAGVKKKRRNESVKCELCKKTFTRNFTLTQHKKRCKKQELSFLCDTCGVTYCSEEYLKTHKCRDHTDLSLLCDLCMVRGGHQKKTLSSGDISYTCDYCNAITMFSVMN